MKYINWFATTESALYTTGNFHSSEAFCSFGLIDINSSR
ncbi:unnamed protein product, partial [Arabidopsis halleri]